MTLSPRGLEAFPTPEALTHTKITWAFSPPAPQVPGVTPGSALCPWCFGHPLWRGERHDGPSKKNSRFDVLNIVLNVQVTSLSYRRFYSTCIAGRNFVFVVPTSKVQRFLASNLDIPIGTDYQTTAPTPSTFIALVSFREPQDLMLHLCLPSSKGPPRP
jgi:hypothetical protein